MEQDIRWKQRFQNFSRAFILLRSELEKRRIDEFNQLEQEGLIQRFEVAYELAWKTLKDYLEHTGLQLDETSPRATIKTANSAGVLKKANVDPEIFIDMLLARNLLSHTYDFATFKRILIEIQDKYLLQLDSLYVFLMEKQDGF